VFGVPRNTVSVDEMPSAYGSRKRCNVRRRVALSPNSASPSTAVTSKPAARICRLDNYATHKTPAIHRWLLRHPRFHLHFTPTSASWLNLVERWFVELTRKQIKRGTHRSTKALRDAITAYIDLGNDAPKPFVWSKTADEILDSVARFCTRISESRH
jgi:hypothetical protein